MYDSAINHRASRPVLDGAALDTAIDEARAELAALLRAPGGGEPGRLTEARLPDAVKPGIHCVRTHWIRGFMAFRRVRHALAVPSAGPPDRASCALCLERAGL